MYPDLIGSSRHGPGFDETRSIGKMLQASKLGYGCVTKRILSDYHPATHLLRHVGNGCLTGHLGPFGVPHNPRQVHFVNFALVKLRLHHTRCMMRTTKDHHTRGIRVQTMGYTQLLIWIDKI
jgi:hypothetical protein